MGFIPVHSFIHFLVFYASSDSGGRVLTLIRYLLIAGKTLLVG